MLAVSCAFRRSRRCILGAVAIAVAFLPPAGARAEQAIQFGLISVQSADRIGAMWGPILRDLSMQLGIDVRPKVFDDYAGVVWSLRSGTTQVAWTGNKAAIEAVDRADAEVFAQRIDSEGREGYRSYLIARAESGPSDVRGVIDRSRELTFAIGDTNSTSGNLVPSYYLFALNGLDPRRLFKRMVQGSHEENILSVADGRADVATVASATFNRVCAAEPVRCASLRVVWQSPVIPNDPLIWRKDLSVGLKARIRAFFLDYGIDRPGKPEAEASEQRRRLGRLGISRFRASDDTQLQPIRELEEFKRRAAALMSDPTPTASVK